MKLPKQARPVMRNVSMARIGAGVTQSAPCDICDDRATCRAYFKCD
jgi:hypothetical protein